MPAYKDKQRGTWFVKYSVTVDGKRKQVLKRGFETKRDALMYEHAAKLTPVASGVTFAELTQNYLNYKSPKQSTRDLYERLLAVHFPFMDQKAAAISKAALMNWYLALPAELSASTKNTLLVIVNCPTLRTICGGSRKAQRKWKLGHPMNLPDSWRRLITIYIRLSFPSCIGQDAAKVKRKRCGMMILRAILYTYTNNGTAPGSVI